MYLIILINSPVTYPLDHDTSAIVDWPDAFLCLKSYLIVLDRCLTSLVYLRHTIGRYGGVAVKA